MVTYVCTCVWGDVGRNIHDDDAMVFHISMNIYTYTQACIWSHLALARYLI